MRNICIIIFIILFSTWDSAFANNNFIGLIKSCLETDPIFQETKYLYEYQEIKELSSKTKLLVPNIYFTHSQNSDQSTSSDSTTNYKLTKLNLSYSLFNFGSDYHNYKSNKHSFQSYKQSLSQTLIEQEKIIISTLLESISKHQKVLILEEVSKLKEKLLELSSAKFKRGILSSDDLIKVKIDLSNAKSSAISARQSYLTAKSRLAAYKTPIKLQDENFPLTSFFKKSGIGKVKNLTIITKNNPELKKLRQYDLSKEFELSSAKKQHYGSFSLNYSRNIYQDNSNSDSLYGHSTSIVYTLPLFENYSLKKKIEQIKAQRLAAKINYQYKKELIGANGLAIKEKLLLSYLNFKNRLTTLAVSRKLFNSSASQFKRGKLSVNDLLIEQDRLLTTKLLTNNAIYDLHISYIDFLHINGLAISENKELLQ